MALPTLKTERLILRPLQLTDLDDLFEYAQDPAVFQPGMWQPYGSYESAKRHLETVLSHYFDGLLWWALEHKADGKMIGRCELSHVDRDDKHAEIGYALNSNYWRQGLMTEAMNRIINYALKEMKLNRIQAYVLIDNTRSYKLLEKMGFEREGHLREFSQVKGYPEDVYIYGLLKSDLIATDSNHINS